MRSVFRATARRGLARTAIAALGSLALLGATIALTDTPRRGDRFETISTAMLLSSTTTTPVAAARQAPVAPAPTTTLVPAADGGGDTPPAEMAPRPTEAPPVPSGRRVTAAAPTAAQPASAHPPAPQGEHEATAPAAATDCLVSLHGKGGRGAATSSNGGIVRVAPTGNAAGWGGRQWMYFPESGYQAALGIVTAAIDEAGCTRVIVGGFSNGGAFAAKLYCRGESFGGRLVRVVVDDPVVDHAVNGCSPAPGVGVTLYWTGALEGTAQPGWSCAGGDWTCEGGTTIGIEAYAAALGTPAKHSPMGGHSPYTGAPELSRF